MTVGNIIKSIHKKHSKSKITTLDDPDALSKVKEFVSTGCLPLDIIMGGGIPVGRLTEIYGDTSTGKSLLAAHILAETQHMGGVAALLDTETATSEDIMDAVGIQRSDLIYACPETVEEVYDYIVELIEARDEAAKDSLMTIVWDSVASTSSDAEIDKIKKEGLGGATMATHARLISMMCRTIPRLVSEKRIAMVFINQQRDKIGVMFGEKETTFGGRAIPYWSSVRLEMSRFKQLEGPNEQPIGIGARCVVTKSKVCPPFGRCEFPILFGVGIDKPGSILWWLKSHKVVTATGGWNKLALPGGSEVKFQQASWSATYFKHKEEIDQLVYESAGVEFVEDEDAED